MVFLKRALMGALANVAVNYPAVKTATTTTVAAAPSSVSIGAGDTVGMTATVTPGSPGFGDPTGSVTFRDGTTTLGAMNLDTHGKAVMRRTAAALGLGNHTITVRYGGSPYYLGSTSGPGVVGVNS